VQPAMELSLDYENLLHGSYSKKMLNAMDAGS